MVKKLNTNRENQTAMMVAKIMAERSSCIAYKVGCVITRDGRIISTGYNGTVAGRPNCNEVNKPGSNNHSEWSRNNEVHAEMNAIIYAAKHGISIDGCTLVTTLSPCPDCLKSILQSGINEIVYLEDYDKSLPDWKERCTSYGVEVTKINDANND